MANPLSQTESNFTNDDYHVPLEYKIVDLPIIQMPLMNTLKTYPCKIYKKVHIPQFDPHEPAYQWKRRCHGRIKFVQSDQLIVIAAFEYGSCHNRLKESPIYHQTFYNLQESTEFAYNWIYLNKDQEEISIAFTSQTDFIQFHNEWENTKVVNDPQMGQPSQQEQNNDWITLIDQNIFM